MNIEIIDRKDGTVLLVQDSTDIILIEPGDLDKVIRELQHIRAGLIPNEDMDIIERLYKARHG